MKKALLLVIGLLTVVMVAQEKSSITVKESTVATGVVVVTWDLNGKSVDLQCTQSMPACTRLKTGKIRHGATAQNRGLYDCQNVDLFPADSKIRPARDAWASIA